MAKALVAEDDTGHFLNILLNDLGDIEWDYSLFDGELAGTHIVTVPFVKNNTVTAILHYFKQSNVSWFKLAIREDAEQIAEIDYDVDIFDYWGNSIAKFATYDNLISRSTHQPFVDWLEEAQEENPIVFRGCESIQVTYQYNEYSGDTPINVVAGGFIITICEGEGDSEGDFGPGGSNLDFPPNGTPSPTSGGKSGKSDKEILEALELLIVELECWTDLDPSVRNDLVKMVNNGLIDPCNSSETASEIVANAIADACEENGENSGEGSGEEGDGSEDEIELGSGDNNILLI